MAQRKYIITIDTPEGDEDTDFNVRIQRHGETVAEFAAPLIHAMTQMTREITTNLESESA